MTAPATTSTVAEWLGRVLDEDEAAARRAPATRRGHDRLRHLRKGAAWMGHASDYDPAHVLAVVAAHREILELHTAAVMETCPRRSAAVTIRARSERAECGGTSADVATLRALAAAYADRPGWQEAWQ